jgi:hypothetical protein
MALNPEQQRQVTRGIAAWRADADVPVACPVARRGL